jgi:predicted O-linked N-acetylglucosamine transferase (SPINDLY family)
MTIEQAFQTALGHHQAGRLAEAEALYGRVLAQVPDHADALHLLGVLACQSGRPAAAIDLIGRAIALRPAVAAYHSNLGESYRKVDARADALACFRRALELAPGLAPAENSLGIVLKDLGRLDEAVAAYRRALALEPAYAEAWNNLGAALREQHRLAEAIDALSRAVTLAPGLAEAHSNLGLTLQDQGCAELAIAAYRRALALRPEHAAAHNNLGVLLKERGRTDEAIAAYRRALALEPGLSQAHNNLGNALEDLGRFDEAIAAFDRALALQPGYVEAHCNRGRALKGQGRLDEAIAAYGRALALEPGLAEAHNNLASALKDQGRLDDALASFQRAIAARPESPRAASNRLFLLHAHPDYDAQAILAEHRQWAARYAAPLAAEIGPHRNDRSSHRRLKLGYVSPDFRSHPVGRLLLPLFAYHDRRQFEVVCYSDVKVPDALTARLQALADGWHSILGRNDREVADQVQADGIDILVDLALHTAGNRLLVFARKPAPVQVTMFGLPATTGLATIDYRLTDPYLDPPSATDGDYTERSVRLPHCYWIYHAPDDAPPVAPLPALASGRVTFGCLNQFFKVSRPALELWAELLRRVPESRLILQSHAGSHRDAVRPLFQDRGVAPERVEFVAPLPRAEYLRLYQSLDLGLDPFPYNGHNSTLESLWMGVPVITLAGRTAVGRGGLSILSNAGLPELVARTPEEYLAIAVQLAADRTRLARLRAELRPQLQASPLVDARQFAADVESAFRGMWQTWCGPMKDDP